MILITYNRNRLVEKNPKFKNNITCINSMFKKLEIFNPKLREFLINKLKTIETSNTTNNTSIPPQLTKSQLDELKSFKSSFVYFFFCVLQ